MYKRINVRTTDGYQLAVYDHGGVDKPVVILVHGYPDTSAVWDGVVHSLRAHYRVVTYDVRGAGASDKPTRIRAYRMSQLVSDLGEVIAAVSPTQPVHVVGHDWGGIQGWHALYEPSVCKRIASYTSVSGPNLDQCGRWVGRTLFRSFHDWLNVVIQLLSSAYIAVFVLPGIAEALWMCGVFDGLLHMLEGSAASGPLADKLHGLKLYRANFFQRVLLPRPSISDAPIQVLAPEHDVYVRAIVQQQGAVPWSRQLNIRIVGGRHWVVRERPEMIAANITHFIEENEAGVATVSARASAQRGRIVDGYGYG